ncbi:uncharacterized protein LOC110854043 [Folsomia candida]|uniref:uncharacterized protein LOC110854043 n=1 Tax=Folsomia candida TaxID=158441 RepID=UPI000B90408D|nr:uncharacterized protein LOC110854043 [Folsomia candida]
MLSRIILFISLISVCYGIFQELTVYSGDDRSGESVSFRQKLSDMTRWQNFIQESKSYCQIGWWEGYDSKNFEGDVSYRSQFHPQLTCFNVPFPSNVQSLRHQGPLDTQYEALSIYEGSPTEAWSGVELMATYGSATGIGFVPKGLLISGGSNWTTYPNEDFTGPSTCWLGSNDEDFTKFALSNTTIVLSMERGCR